MFSMAEVSKITLGTLVGSADIKISNISTDSRCIAPGELFVPLSGKNFDGHDYITSLPGQGVSAALCRNEWLERHHLPESFSCVAVKDTLYALGSLAAAYRKRFALTVLGVTGSNGKTTTKEMLASVLSQLDTGLKTEGNLNNLIGLPAMIFRLKPEHCWAVLEMGMSEPGEIDRLAEIAQPSTGIVLNAMPAHLQSMGSIDAIARAKGELLLRVANNGLAVVNADDPAVSSLPCNPLARKISFGIDKGDVRAEAIRTIGTDCQLFRLDTPKGNIEVKLHAFGRHNIYNAIAASAALIDIAELETIAQGLEAFRPYYGRFRFYHLADGRIVVDDSYNANPASCSAALSALDQIKGTGRIFAVFGDMLELGSGEADLHYKLGVQAAETACRLFLLGTLTANTAEGAIAAGMPVEAVTRASSHEEIACMIQGEAEAGDIILIKGSRGMKMEKTVAALLSTENRKV